MTSHTAPYLTYSCEDVLGHIDGIHSRAMFGGHGIYQNGVIFAIIVSSQLYFKVDHTNKAQYEQAGSNPFTYNGKAKPIQMSYWTVPESIIEDPNTLSKWVSQSVEISQKNKKR